MSYKEKDLTADFSKFMRIDSEAKLLNFSFAIEFKCKKNKETLNLTKDFQPQQLPMLNKAKFQQLYHKLSDQGQGMKPFDAFSLYHTEAFVGVMWYKLRKPKILYLIGIEDINRILENKCYKLTEEEASKVAAYKFQL